MLNTGQIKHRQRKCAMSGRQCSTSSTLMEHGTEENVLLLLLLHAGVFKCSCFSFKEKEK